MRRRIYYRAFIKVADMENPIYQWYGDLIDPDKEEEVRMKIQIEHMRNRIVGAWRWNVPFEINWKVGEMVQLEYSI